MKIPSRRIPVQDPTATRALDGQDAALRAVASQVLRAGRLVGYSAATDSAVDTIVSTSGGTIPFDNTKPQKTEGKEVLALTYIPQAAGNWIIVEAEVLLAPSTGGHLVAALFVDEETLARVAMARYMLTAGGAAPVAVRMAWKAADTERHTFRLRAGMDAGGAAFTVTVNGQAGARMLGGAAGSFIQAQEVAV